MADVAIDLNISGITQVLDATGRFSKELAKPENRRRIALAASHLVTAAIQGETPISDRIHYRYKTPKISGKLRAPKGLGRKVASYVPGNLRKSTMDLSERRSKYKKFGIVIVGPLYSRKSRGNNIGSSKRNADGYYAHMVLGNSAAYQQKIAIAGARKVSSTAYAAMIQEGQDLINELKRKNGFE